MALSQQIANKELNTMNGALLEKVIIGNDLSGLNSIEKVEYVKNVCQTLGLNPVTKPIQLMKFQGKEIPYFTKDASEQLRKINHVSINKIDTKMLEAGVYVVTAYATTPDGRQDSSTGVISISGLKGDLLGNAMMKAETKAKRRVTLSICGLGFIDECEVDSIPNAQKIDIPNQENVKLINLNKKTEETTINENDIFDITEDIHEIMTASTLEFLQSSFKRISKYWMDKNDKEILDKIIEAKDIRKKELNQLKLSKEINSETGEILQ